MSQNNANVEELSRGPRLGIIGGGQLARMLALAAAPLGCRVVVVEKQADCPAAGVSAEVLAGDWNDPAILLNLAARVDVVTLENEFVNTAALEALEAAGHRLYPAVVTMRQVQDKLVQKQTLQAAGLAVAEFAAVESPEALREVGRKLGWPLVLKARRNGYDGKGNYTLRSEGEIEAAWTALGGGRNSLYAEAFCPYVRELAVMITRGRDGAVVEYPVVETVQREHICHIVRVPAELPVAVARRAAEMAHRAMEAFNGVGSFGVEMFLLADGRVFINEMAPRVHNSGHYTIEACDCSQFENHVRAVLGWPLGSTALRRPGAAMVNLLGAGPGNGWPAGWQPALTVRGAHVHVYGKAASSKGRKMGHVTALGDSAGAAEALARQAAEGLQFGGRTEG